MLTVFAVLMCVVAYGQPDARRLDGGVWDQPHADPRLLTEAQVDTEMWPIVQRINQSGWVWTTESCQGHAGTPEAAPLLGVITNDFGRFMGLVAEAHAADVAVDPTVFEPAESQNPQGVELRLSFWQYPVMAIGRYQVRIVGREDQRARVLRIWAAVARKVNE